MADKNRKRQTVGDRVYAARVQRGWNTTELSIQADVSIEQISRYENGTKLPSLEVLVRIADALQLPLSALQPSELDQYGACSPGEAAVLPVLGYCSGHRRYRADRPHGRVFRRTVQPERQPGGAAILAGVGPHSKHSGQRRKLAV